MFSKSQIKLWLVGPFLASLLAACAPSRYVRPLAEGEVAVTGNLGGSLFTNFGSPIPIPLTAVGVGYGIDSTLTAHGALHLTALSFGVGQVDLGVVKSLRRPDGWIPGVSLAPTANLAIDFWEGKAKFWPQLDANAWWEYGERKHFAYAGFSTWFELAGKRAHDEPQPQRILPGVQIGHTFRLGTLDLQTELKFNDFSAPNRDLTVSYVGINGRGAIGVYLGLTKRF